MPANSSGAISGTLADAVIDGVLVLRLTEWQVSPESSESAWGDSDSNGYTVRMPARGDAKVSLTGKHDSNRRIYTLFDPGDIVILALWENDQQYWAFPRALCQSFTITFNQDTKEVVEWSAEFGSDGIWYRPGAAGAPSYSKPSS